MAKTVTITLREPIAGHSGPVTEVVLREPRADEFIEIGEPRSYVRNDKGEMRIVDSGEALRKYFDRCIVKPDPLAAMQMSLTDIMAVREAFMGFFDQALLAASPPPATSLSSISGSADPKSAAA